MDWHKQGGAAFPHAGHDNGPGNIKGRPEDGMSLRDWFAGQALIALLTHPEAAIQRSEKAGTARARDIIAQMAYEAADAMLAARDSEAS